MPTATAALTAQDLGELQLLYARSARLIDAGDNEGWADLYTADGVFERRTSPTPGIDAVYIAGRAALAEFATGVVRRGGGRHRHWLSGVVVEPNGEDAAVGSCYFQVIDAAGPGRTIILGSGTYQDQLARTPDGWRIRHRLAVADEGPS